MTLWSLVFVLTVVMVHTVCMTHTHIHTHIGDRKKQSSWRELLRRSRAALHTHTYTHTHKHKLVQEETNTTTQSGHTWNQVAASKQAPVCQLQEQNKAINNDPAMMS